jgi:tetratricopeptide (TPR) repeat protein
MLLPLRLLTSLVGVAYAGSASETSPELAESVSAISIDPNSTQQLQLWRAEIGAAESRADEKSKNELSRMIERVRSVTFQPKKKTVEPESAPVKVRPKKPPEPPADAAKEIEEEEEKQRTTPKPTLPYDPISDKTMQMLKNLSKHPEKVDNPFELGETLFLSGNLEDAAVFYIEALNRTEPNDVDPAGNRAWILFQAGNSLRNSHLQKASKMYKLLLTEYPDSVWTQVAKAQMQLIDWYMRDEPQELILEMEQTVDK